MFAILHALVILPPTCSSRGAGFKPRNYFCAINSISHCGGAASALIAR